MNVLASIDAETVNFVLDKIEPLCRKHRFELRLSPKPGPYPAGVLMGATIIDHYHVSELPLFEDGVARTSLTMVIEAGADGEALLHFVPSNPVTNREVTLAAPTNLTRIGQWRAQSFQKGKPVPSIHLPMVGTGIELAIMAALAANRVVAVTGHYRETLPIAPGPPTRRQDPRVLYPNKEKFKNRRTA